VAPSRSLISLSARRTKEDLRETAWQSLDAAKQYALEPSGT